MVYLILFLVLLAVIFGMFALAKGEGQSYSRQNQRNSKGNDNFNSFTL